MENEDIIANGDQSQNENDEEMDVNVTSDQENGLQCVSLPSAEEGDDDDLVYDESAYIFYHEAKTGSPCLSFDIIQDNLGDDRADKFPLTMYAVAGTQAENNHSNSLIVMKMSNVNKYKHKSKDDDDESDDDDEDEEEEGNKPSLDCVLMRHTGCVNRVKVTNISGVPFAASWSELGKVHLWNISEPLKVVNDRHLIARHNSNNVAYKPVFSFSGHRIEGYAIGWAPLSPGTLATGDCRKNIHLWKPLESGSWSVDQRTYRGHTDSVEDIQWSPTENNVMASCSVDKSIRIWDVRAPPNKACMLTAENTHDSDVNVIHWNKFEPFIVSGGDDGKIKIWDLRNFPTGGAVCTFKHHTAPITSVEWHPTDSSVFAASGSDNQLTLWDIAVERDTDLEKPEDTDAESLALPPQLLFVHQGQKEIKELHWHPQMPGVLISTAQSGFNVFRTLSV